MRLALAFLALLLLTPLGGSAEPGAPLGGGAERAAQASEDAAFGGNLLDPTSPFAYCDWCVNSGPELSPYFPEPMQPTPGDRVAS